MKSSLLTWIIFLLIVIFVFFLINFVVYKRIKKGFNLSAPASRYLFLFFLGLGIVFFFGQFLLRFLHNELLYLFGASWLGILSIAFSIFLIEWLLATFLKSQQKMIFSVACGLILMLVLIGFYRGLKAPRLITIELRSESLPIELNGLKILQISDLHINGKSSVNRVRKIADHIENIKPDLIVLTGDLIDVRVCDLKQLCFQLTRWKAEKGIFAVTGNHEYYIGKNVFQDLVKTLSWRLLKNELLVTEYGLEIVGVNDEQANRFEEQKTDIAQFLKSLPPKKGWRIFLNHRPSYFKEAVQAGVDLQLSGHTHAGQIPPMDLLVCLGYRYSWGLYRLNKAFIYTTSGSGLWGPPMRIFSRNEIVLFKIYRDNGGSRK